jgi:hypothetical protein
LIFDFYWMTQDEYIFPNTSGYENLKTFGLNLIKNDSLRNMITLLYNNDIARIAVGNDFNPNINTFLLPFFQKNFALNTDTTLKYTLKINDSLLITYPRKLADGVYQKIGYIPLKEDAIKRDKEFILLAYKTLEMRRHKLHYYNLSINRAKTILKMIDRLYQIK